MNKTQKTPSRGKNQPLLKNKLTTSKSNSSLQAASNTLLISFQGGDYQAAVNLAKNIITQYPDHAFSWKVLGAALKNLGKLKESLEAKKKAALLSPQDAEAQNNLGTTLQGLGRLEEAMTLYKLAITINPNFFQAYINLGKTLQALGRLEDAQSACKKVIAIKPDYAQAYDQLGIILNQLKRFEEAESSYKKAIEIKSDYAEALCNLGITLKELGRIEEAEACYRKAIALKQDLEVAHSNLGILLQELGRLEEAVTSYKKAILIAPNHADAYNNLGSTLKELGYLEESEDYLNNALVINPSFVEAHYNLANTLQELGRIDEAIAGYKTAIGYKANFVDAYFNLASSQLYKNDLGEASKYYQKVMDIDQADQGLKAGVHLAVINFLRNNQLACNQLLIDSATVLQKDSSEFKNTISYWKYLTRLLELKTVHLQENLSNEKLNKIYVIGESHSLAYHYASVKIPTMESSICKSRWIVGCKQWHLGNAKSNQYKSGMQNHFDGLPRNSTVVIVIGEIDCRINDGIIPYLKKNPQVSMGEAASSTIIGYLNYLFTVNAPLDHHLIISGIPAPNIDFSLISPEDTKLLISLIQHFNMVLKQESIKLGFGFLDAYALTNRGDGISNKEWHIDDYHLKPSAIQQLFSNHYSSGSNLQ
jgi:tetratricopeptide (TPR) repeat protein